MKSALSMKIFFVGLCLLLSANLIFARDVEERSVDNMNSWQETYDINSRKGKFNVIVTAQDRGGNTTIGGPFNIYIDPESDLPVTGITNPAPNLRVPGNLNIVGICVDDDAVEYVELILDGDTENPIRAKGKEFWSHFLDTTGMPEGDHTIEVYGVDINGLRGRSVKHKWCLDREAPVTNVNNYAMGTLVSGTVKLEGIVSDGNGIASLEYSVDDGANFETVKLSKIKNSTDSTFSLSFDTKKLDDGPAVMWFFARDGQGTVGFYPFLLFVDNTKPEIKIAYPPEKEKVNGVFTAAGMAKDIVGLKSLKWSYGGQSGSFDLIPGNPYWAKEFTDLKNIKNGKLVITAEDTAGNVSVAERNIVVDPNTDKPVVTIDWPKEGAMLSGNDELFVRGIAVDDDSVKLVKVFVDGSEVGTVETESVFYKSLIERKSLGSGKHTVSVSAVDIYGVEGAQTTVSFTTSGNAPYFYATKVVGGSGAGDLPYGKTISPEQGGNIEIEGGASSGIAEAWYTISKPGVANGERQNLSVSKSETKKVFSIPVSSLPWGVIELNYHITDTMGRTADYNTCVYVANLTDIRRTTAPDMPDSIEDESVQAKITTVNGESYSKFMKTVISPDPKAPGATLVVDIVSEKALTLSYKIYGETRPGEKAVYEGKAVVTRPDKKAPAQQAVINLAGMPARATNVEITLQSGKDYTSTFGTQILIAREHDANDIADRKGVYWIPNGDVRYSNEFSAYILPQKEFAAYVNGIPPISATVIGGGGNLTANVEGNVVYLNCNNPGTYRGIQIRATDSNGQTYTSPAVNIIAAEEGAHFEITSPVANAWVRNSLRIQGNVTDSTGIASLEYSLDNGESWNTIPLRIGASNVPIYLDINITARDEGLIPIDLRAKNSSGQISYYRTAVCRDITPPEVQVIVPLADLIVNGQTTIAMLAKDNGTVRKVEYAPANNASARRELALTSMPTTNVGTPEQPLNSAMNFFVTDAAGNETRVNKYDFNVDNKSDLPVVQVQLPIEVQVVTKDFKISGVVLDDDGPSTVYYRIDNAPFKKFSDEPSYSFEIDVPLSAVTDNEHTITMYGVDINGVRGQDTVSKFRVSLEEPKCVMTSPDINTTQKGIVTLRGTASDKNGVKCVEVSLDNGNTYNKVDGTTNWNYTFDTRVLPDGTHVVFVRATDNYDIQSLYSTQLTLDNTKPEINLELPLDDSQTSGNLFFSGFALDNIELKELYITIASLDGRAVPSRYTRINMNVDSVITQVVDLTSLDNGNYNVKVSGVDAAGNITSASRSIKLDKTVAAASVDIYYPLNGEYKQGGFTIMGAVRSERKVKELTLYVDGKQIATTEPKITSYYKFDIEQAQFEDGTHTYRVQALLENGVTINSIQQTFEYAAYGPWVRIDNFDYGDFAFDRPIIKGTAGYSISELEIEAAKMKGATKDQKWDIESRSVKSVEISWDNGRTFKQISKGPKWKWRIENDDLAAGFHFMLVRAIMNNGEIATTRCIIQIDKTAPFVRIIAPGVGGRYNQQLDFSGLSSDDVGLTDVTIALRKGDKNSYGIPGFIQGLYIDANFWGATLFDVGIGLTFFDDNVRLQLSWGQFTQSQRNIFDSTPMRYGGNSIFGLKIIANIANIPFGPFMGHDWDWLSANIAVGASFKLFNETASGKSQILSAIIAQLEFPRAHFKKWKRFSTMSFYTEFQLWFIPSDVESASVDNLIFQTSFGIRTNIF